MSGASGESVRIVAIAGSLRRGSSNAALLRAIAEEAPSNVVIEIASIRDIPLYDGDVDAAGTPPAVATLKEQVASSDGLLLASPEYNASVPGVLKNAIDWISRPASDIARVFGGKPVGVIGASAGMGGTSLAQVAWLPVLRLFGCDPYFGQRLQVGGAGSLFDADGRLVDDATRERVRAYVAGFGKFVEGRRATR